LNRRERGVEKMLLSISSTWPGAPWSALLVAGTVAVISGLAAGALMNWILRTIGHVGYVAETSEQRATRIYMEKAKQGMKD
jgi:hypothetical protein